MAAALRVALAVVVVPLVALNFPQQAVAARLPVAPAAGAAPANTAVTTLRNDNGYSGQYTNETILNQSNVNQSQFGKRVSYPVDGQLYAQPLYLPGLSIGGSTHNVVFAATENDTVYAFDADATSAVAPLWKKSLLPSGATAVSNTTVSCNDLQPGLVIAGAAACARPGTVGPSPAPPGPAAEATAGQVAAGYYRAVAGRDYRRAFTYLAADSTGPDGRNLTWPAFLQLADTMDSQEGPVVDFSAATFGDLVVMTVDRKRSGPYHSHLRIARAAGRLAIVSIDRI